MDFAHILYCKIDNEGSIGPISDEKLDGEEVEVAKAERPKNEG